MGPWISAAVVAVAVVAMAVVVRHRRRRDQLYLDLARERDRIIGDHPVEIATAADAALLAADFDRELLVRVPLFLSEPCLAALRAEAESMLPRMERTYLPAHKKGGTVSYEAISRWAPRCLSFYHSADVQRWIGAITGERVHPTRDQDQSSLSLLCYNEAGDHINWHYDHNFYKGRHFTVLLSLVNQNANGGLSESRLERKTPAGAVASCDTAANSLVVFEGAKVLHRATPAAAGDLRIILSMTYCSDPRISRFKEFIRRVKDTAFFGIRALWD
jgi:hypothetical protein